MIERIKRRIHRAGEKLDRLLGSDKPAIPSLQAPTAPSPAPVHANTPAQPLLDSALPHSNTINNGSGSDPSPTPAQAMNQASSTISPNHELTQAESPSEQAPVTVPELQTGVDLVSPVEEATSKLSTTWSGLRALLSVLDKSADAFGPLKSAVGGLVACLEIYEGQVAAREEYQQLKIDLESASREIAGYIGGAAPPSMESSILKLAQDIKDETKLVNRKTQRNALERSAEATVDADEVLARYRRIQRHLDAFALSAGMKIWQIVDDQATRNRLKELPNSPEAQYCSTESTESRDVGRNGCTPNTRVEVLQQLHAWARDTESRKIYWLNGMAGTGKTTIAYSLCSQLERVGQLAASFFCSRQIPSCRKVGRIIPSIAYQLSFLCRPFRYEISGLIERDPHVYNKPVDKQFQTLIAAPLRKIRDKLREDLVVVVDALDECEDPDSVGRMLSALLAEASNLPIKLLLTSRPEPKIVKRMQSEQGAQTQSELRLHELERSVVQSDIETYLATELKELSLEPQTLAKLVEQCGVLFIYASTVVRFITYDDSAWSDQRLLLVTSNHSHQSLDELYSSILAAAVNDKHLEQGERNQITQVLHTVICAQEPLTVEVIAGLLGICQVNSVQKALRPLLSVLQVSSTTGLVTTLHESFPDYLFDASRSGGFFCNSDKRNLQIALTCLGLVKSPSPPFNICRLESSYVLDSEVSNLQSRVSEVISPCLYYASRYWDAHIKWADGSDELMEGLYELLSTRLLLWIEILNLTGQIHTGARMMSDLNLWISHTHVSSNTKELARDAARFVSAFASGPIRSMTPHIYVSALALWPKNRPVSRYHLGRIQGLAAVAGSALEARHGASLGVLDVHNEVCCVAYSPDGRKIASGSSGNDICIWDAHTGQRDGQPLAGHSGGVRCVAYSPDGKRIISSSDDGTIRFWDAQSGQILGQPPRGHTAGVNSAAYSPNGLYIVSGSDDHTVRVWDSRTGQALGGPLEGHTEAVLSVSYSSDSAYIVSGSEDYTVRVWDAKTRTQLGEPMKGHTSYVHSVAFSPDGLRIISGSGDRTIRIWDAKTGHALGQPLQGHARDVRPVAYSPNGAYIASGSDDQTICIWDATTGQMLGQPLRGHTDWVRSVAFSPDGLRIISGSDDHTIRIWDAHIGQASGQPPEGHTDYVYSVAYSPDGARIASGSGDNTICIWDASTGRMVGQPLKGHTGDVNSVAYSHDGKRIVSGSDDRTVRIWDASSGQMVGQPLQGHTERVWSVMFSPDDSRIASGSGDSTMCIWDANTGQMMGQPLKGHTGTVWSVAFSPDGARIVSGSGDETICIWDATTGQMVGQPLTGHTDWVRSVAYSPSGTHIVSGSGNRTICIWDASTGQMVGQPLKGHTDDVRSVAYSPDGARIVSGSNDMTICIWDAHTGQMLGRPLEGHTDQVLSVAYSPDGKHIVSGSSDKSIRVWDVCALSNLGEASQHDSNSTRQHPSASDIPARIPDDIDYPSSVYEPWTQRGVPMRPNPSDANAWTLSDDGWVVGHNLKPLLWVPPELRDTLQSYKNTRTISTKGSWSLDLSKAKFETEWQQCYRP